MQFGLDYLGGAKYPDLIMREHPAGWAAGFFWEVDGFGNASKIIEAVAASKRAPIIRVHLLWRDDHKYSAADYPTIAKRARQLSQIIDRHQGILWCVSGACEHRLGALEARKIADVVAKNVPAGTVIVNVPLKGGADIQIEGRTVINEHHGSEAQPAKGAHAFSFDGSNCVDANVTKLKERFSKAAYFMLWNCQMNGRMKAEDTTPRPQRKAWPTMNEIDSFIYLSRDKGATKLSRGWLFKSHADRHQTPPEPRAGKPVVIGLDNEDTLRLVCDNGQVVGVAKNGGTFTGGGYRYYFTEFGYLMAEKAKRIQGSPIVRLMIGNREIGRINPAFREGAFR